MSAPAGRSAIRRAISADGAASPRAAYSQAIATADLLHLSGQIGWAPGAPAIEAGFEAQVRQIFMNIRAILAADGRDLQDLLSVTTYLTSVEDFEAFNALYAELMTADPPPARTTVIVALPLGALVEISCVAMRDVEGPAA